MYYVIYNVLSVLAVIIGSPFFIYKFIFSKRWRIGIKERFGFYSESLTKCIKHNDACIIVHAASVGEVKAARILVDKLKEAFPKYKIVFSTVTPEGNSIANDISIGDIRVFVPLDFLFSVRKFYKTFNPGIVIIVETELWPNLIREAKRRKSKVILVNGRISQKSYPVYRLIRLFLRKIFTYIDIFSVREEVDKGHLLDLGAPVSKLRVSGNIKYDMFSCSSRGTKKLGKLYKEFGLKQDDLVFVAGSTHENEEEIIISVYLDIIKKFPSLKLIIAPRHLQRIGRIEQLLKDRRAVYIKKTDISETSSTYGSAKIILLDVMGELINAYSVATVTFVGGSLVPKGGQNIMEPASLGKVVMFGPYMDNFSETAWIFKESQVAIEVGNRKHLRDTIIYLLDNPHVIKAKGKKLRETVLSMQGATDRTVNLIQKLMQ